MKKLFAIVLAVAMIAAMAIAVSAEDPITTLDGKTGNFTSIAITGTVTELGYQDTYKVTLAYENVAFAYSEGTRTWNADSMTWGDVQGAKWTANEATITITNKSSQSVTAAIAATDVAKDVQIAFTGLTDGKVTIAKAANDDVTKAGAAQTATVTATASGTPAVGTTAIATITVSLV